MEVSRKHAIGFIGLGLMGEPMALNLLRANTPLVVWNRSTAKSGLLARAGGSVAKDAKEVFQRCEVVILMLRDGEATDIVLGRRHPNFGSRVQGHTIINMATTSAFYSKGLEADIRAHGGRYVEGGAAGRDACWRARRGDFRPASACPHVPKDGRLWPNTERIDHEVCSQPVHDLLGDRVG